METKTNPAGPILESVEQYAKTSYELIELKLLDKTADLAASLTIRLSLTIIFLFLLFILNIAVALWAGDLLGKNYYGFFAVAGFYALIGIFLYIFRDKWIKKPIRNSIISHVLN